MDTSKGTLQPLPNRVHAKQVSYISKPKTLEEEYFNNEFSKKTSYSCTKHN
jgi:hypothetical protein